MERCEGACSVAFHSLYGLLPVAWVIKPISGRVVWREECHEPVVRICLEEGPVLGIHTCNLGNVVDVDIPFDQSLQSAGRVLEILIPAGGVLSGLDTPLFQGLQVHLPAEHAGDPPRLELGDAHEGSHDGPHQSYEGDARIVHVEAVLVALLEVDAVALRQEREMRRVTRGHYDQIELLLGAVRKGHLFAVAARYRSFWDQLLVVDKIQDLPVLVDHKVKERSVVLPFGDPVALVSEQ